MRISQIIVTLTLVALAVGTGKRDPCARAFRQCDWEFSGFRGQIPVFPGNTPPDKAFTPRIVSKDKREVIGILNTNGVVPEFILRRPVLITHFGHPPFTPTHFKPFAIDYIMGSGIGHQTFQGNQRKVSWGKCVRVFFTTYQLLMPGKIPTVKNINVNRHAFKCVVFRID